MASTANYKLGEFDYPRGWFMIGDAAQMGPQPETVHFFGKDMVFYRGASGTPYLVDAYCPHMGAHLGINSTSYIVRDGEHVDGESIRCPFHGWRFGADGRCNAIPYSPDFIPKAARLTTYPVIERAGIIWMWHDPEGQEPDQDLPAFAAWDLEDDGWVRWVIDDFGTLALHPIEIVDNMADFGHMGPIHGSLDNQYFDNVFDGHKVIQRFDAGHRTLTADTGETLSLDTWYEGPAILQADMRGTFPSHMLIAHTPVDDGTVRVWHALMVKMPTAEAALADLQVARGYQKASHDALAQDVEIWANKQACFNPMQIPADGPYGKVRIWYSQFYNPRSKTTAIQQRVNGQIVTYGEKRVVERAA
ncbi:Rieske 2Fe-2S domain-containing protein [Caenibius sp. WL]|uniref:Rieske 2Fe-2S domain-containing protein n=1 Tax=Caenibius sp. WL TaxID=2872646 RepID=UPI001C99CE07|nr:Rieske 2Fe-2S domain-containing protein [Caenibius sp. WL]QZP09522.1 Rieske 2Fe-2S domain-containing protein [Caenibius sp. WL]